MGRWGDTIYESDAALDYFAGISDLILREMNHLTSPEQVSQSTNWIMDVVTVIEIMLLFDKSAVATASYLMDQERAVERWRDVLFKVWDAEWDDSANTRFPLHAYIYRKEHRQVIDKWFDRLTEISAYFSVPGDEFFTRELSDFEPNEVLPYFSLTYSPTDTDKRHPLMGHFLGRLIEMLVHSIVFVLSDENRKVAIGSFEIEDVWVAVDVIGLLCESYTLSPTVTGQTVEIWQKKMLDIWKARTAEEKMKWIENDEYKNVMNIFEKLKMLAQKYPPMFV